MEKGWWKTGERRRIKGRHEHLVCKKEQKGGAGDEKAEDTEVGERFKNLVIILVFVFTYKRIICGLTTALQGQHQVVDAQGRPRRLVHG